MSGFPSLAIEQTQNEMLLLNVVRSMRHSPLYITRKGLCRMG
jgi:hypothetical protein